MEGFARFLLENLIEFDAELSFNWVSWENQKLQLADISVSIWVWLRFGKRYQIVDDNLIKILKSIPDVQDAIDSLYRTTIAS